MTLLQHLQSLPFFDRAGDTDGAWTDAPCLFMLSTGRAGSVTMTHLLNQSPDVSAHHEPKPNLLRVYRRAYADGALKPARYTKLFAGARRELIAPAQERGQIYAESTLLKFFAYVIADLMPNAKFLVLHRHPGAVVRSGMRRGWYGGHALDGYKLNPLPADPAATSWRDWSPFQRICWMWHVENAFFLSLLDVLGPDRVLPLGFTDWIDPDTEAWRDVFQFIRAREPNEHEVRAVLAVRHNKQVYGNYPRYEEWTADQVHTLQAIARPTMQRLGYAEPGPLPSTDDMGIHL